MYDLNAERTQCVPYQGYFVNPVNGDKTTPEHGRVDEAIDPADMVADDYATRRWFWSPDPEFEPYEPEKGATRDLCCEGQKVRSEWPHGQRIEKYNRTQLSSQDRSCQRETNDGSNGAQDGETKTALIEV